MSELIDQPGPAPTRKVTASTAAGGLVTSIVTAIFGIMPDAGEEVRGAVTVIVDWAVGFFLGGGATFLAGYFVRDRAQQ